MVSVSGFLPWASFLEFLHWFPLMMVCDLQTHKLIFLPKLLLGHCLFIATGIQTRIHGWSIYGSKELGRPRMGLSSIWYQVPVEEGR